jgi:hypothetical protein
MRIAERLAVIHDQQRERPLAGRTEDRGFELHAFVAGSGGHHDDLLIERRIEHGCVGIHRTAPHGDTGDQTPQRRSKLCSFSKRSGLALSKLEISHTSYFCEATQLILGSALLRFNTRLCNTERFFEGIVGGFPTFR